MIDPKLKVLVVDDVQLMRKVVIRTCQDLGLSQFVEYENGFEAWEGLVAHYSRGQPFDIVISDVTMPHMTGIDFLKKVRADVRFKTLPFIMVTAESEKHMIIDAIQAGVSQYLMKPFAPNILAEKLNAIVAQMKKKTA